MASSTKAANRTESDANARPRKVRHTPEEIERGLREIALCGGNTRRASRQLKARGVKIPHTTLDAWTRMHAERYQEVREHVLPLIYARLAEESEDLAREYAEAERETLERFRDELPNLRASEAAGALRNLTTSRGISVDKANVIRGRPTSIVEHVQLDDILAKWQRLGVIDSTAEDDEPPELPPAA